MEALSAAPPSLGTITAAEMADRKAVSSASTRVASATRSPAAPARCTVPFASTWRTIADPWTRRTEPSVRSSRRVPVSWPMVRPTASAPFGPGARVRAFERT